MGIEGEVRDQLIDEMSRAIVAAAQESQDSAEFMQKFKGLLGSRPGDAMLGEALLRLPEDLFVPLAEKVMESDRYEDWERFVKLYEAVADFIKTNVPESPIVKRFDREACVIQTEVEALDRAMFGEVLKKVRSTIWFPSRWRRHFKETLEDYRQSIVGIAGGVWDNSSCYLTARLMLTANTNKMTLSSKPTEVTA
ncbi:hypothetical protein [Thermoflexus sp.]|uniref:hypothetical protein n=1 Tax=Thermoflexus sp. TaxID=1969742 RepID=UPI0035E42A7F